MPFDLWTAFVIASCILLIIPGPTILTVISYSITHGKRANIPLVTAVALGDSAALLLSLFGLGVLLATSAWMFTILKWAGGLYLIYLGIRLFRSEEPSLETVNAESIDSNWKLFINTWLVTALNPKGITFFIAFLPQFIDPSSSLSSQLWILSVTFVVLATISTTFYAVFASRARQLLTSPKAFSRFNLGGGSLLVAAGTLALTVEKPT